MREIWTSVLQTLKKLEVTPRGKLLEEVSKLVETKKLDIVEELFSSSGS